MKDEIDIQTYPVMPVPYDFKSQEEYKKAKRQIYLATMRYKGRLKKEGKDPSS